MTSDQLVLGKFSALAHDVRQSIMRMLLAGFPESMTAGDLAKSHSVSANSISFHLKEMLNAGLVTSERHGRFILYRAEPSGIAELVSVLASLRFSEEEST